MYAAAAIYLHCFCLFRSLSTCFQPARGGRLMCGKLHPQSSDYSHSSHQLPLVTVISLTLMQHCHSCIIPLLFPRCRSPVLYLLAYCMTNPRRPGALARCTTLLTHSQEYLGSVSSVLHKLAAVFTPLSL